ncbi:hypothetical protein E2C01_048564 [Portunus trituberculatus]|uniref:Uncharacterized protein n=1 Tax=Portunus trituberculatus TaxID=210409 RepID=A0A5B7G463_PORTR|nr:hypothetical protein [Portunus trituberculatus]
MDSAPPLSYTPRSITTKHQTLSDHTLAGDGWANGLLTLRTSVWSWLTNGIRRALVVTPGSFLEVG